ncbi:predicted protein [Lichtheimia corymbifera JMRC:FSU:9682]|uniref:Uncharacterized protein n=1 Tax=Lichtheimia corymbifera JMRC:FSU:9682 TaxID=1263082 RepID=A0A068RIC3_9FUNG|nr:predicted protein [Lichtheimia corymbifera JMRC:FSU:9682]
MLSAKVDFTEIIARSNLPLEAMVDDYDVTAADKWNGSGKTQFIRNFIDALNEAQMHMKLAIVTYDMNYESFFFNIVKRELGLPCERISSVLDETWEREYGVLFPTSTAQSYGSNQPTADLVIALDIRLRPNNPVFEKIESHSGNDNDRPPRLWLVTMGSAEMRAAQYMENDTDRPEWDNEWWCDAPGYFDLVWKQNTWPTEEEAMTQRQHVVQSVMQWDTTTTTTIPSPLTPPEIHIAGSSTPPLPPSTPTEPPPTTATDTTTTTADTTTTQSQAG